MATINYTFADGKIRTFEVDEHTALAYEQIEDETRREEERARWRTRMKLNSLEEMSDFGVQFASDEHTPEEALIKNEENRRLHNAIAALPENQRNLVNTVFYCGVSLVEIARIEGTTYQAIQNRLAKILKKLKKFLI